MLVTRPWKEASNFVPEMVLRTFLLLWVQAHLVSPELLKLPMLFGHFVEHCQEDGGDTDFLGFLAAHYLDKSHAESDDKGHHDLPFHHHHGMVVDQAVVKIPGSEPLRAVSFPEVAAKPAIPLPASGAPMSGHAGTLLQPPRPLA